jgi:hypothetical protein
MIIPNKHSGYQAGIRIYPLGGGGGGGGESAPAAPAAPPARLPSAAPAPQFQTYGQGDRTGSLVQAGAGMRPSALDYSRPIFDPNYKDNITGYEQSSQFYQPIYQSQYQNYARPATQFDTSMYGTQPVQSPLSAGGASRENISNAVNSWITNNPGADINTTLAAMRGSGINRTDIQAAGGVNNYGPSTQQTFNPFSAQPTQQTSMFGGQMQGGGYGQFGMNNPFSPFSNSFLNMDPNLNRGTVADKANMYRNAIQSGFGDQQIYNQATGLFGQQSPQAWGYLQGSAMGMTPGLGQGSEQDKIGFYQGARNQGFNDQTIRNAANQMIGNQSQGDWSYLQNRSGFGGGSGGFGNQFMPQMQTPFQPPVQQSPFRSSGPSQAIVGRSSQMRGTPNVMRRAEGGITSLMDKA